MSTIPPTGGPAPDGQPHWSGQEPPAYPQQNGPGMPPPPGMGAPGMPPPPAPPKKSKAPMIILIIVGVLVLCCGGGGAAAYFSKDDTSTSASGDSSSGDSATPTAPTTGDVNSDLDGYHTGDCLTIENGSNDVSEAQCTDPGAYKVLLRVNYTTADSACDSTDATETLTQDGTGTKDDFILCIAKAQ
ncbi:LppU/SCO3897 family protein [Actinocatenispora rupis]|nr:hypothetical protein [Actinocatenispora rupis]